METLDWVAIGATIAGFLSAAAAARSAALAQKSVDVAGLTETRMAATTRDQAWRELHRARSHVHAQFFQMNTLVDQYVMAARTASISTGAGPGNSREKVLLDATSELMKKAAAMDAVADYELPDAANVEAIGKMLIELDRAALGVEACVSALSRRLRTMESDRIVASIRAGPTR